MTGWYLTPSESVSLRSAKQPKPSIPTCSRANQPSPWTDAAGMRNHLAHRYFDTVHAIGQATLSEDLPPLVAAAKRLLDHLAVGPQSGHSLHTWLSPER